jgi:hypothetical protein
MHKVFYRVRSGAGTLTVTLSGSSIYAWQCVAYQRNGTGVITRNTSFLEADSSLGGSPDTGVTNAAHSASQGDSTYVVIGMADINPVSTTLGTWSGSGGLTFRVNKEDTGIRTSDGIGDVVNLAAGSHGNYRLNWTNDAVAWGQQIFTIIIYELVATKAPPIFQRRPTRIYTRRR